MANKLYVGTEEGVITIGSHEGMRYGRSRLDAHPHH